MNPHLKILFVKILFAAAFSALSLTATTPEFAHSADTAREADTTEAVVDFDTTRVRQVIPIKKSLTERVIDIPGEILKLPFYAFELAAYALVMNPPVSKLMSLLRKPGKETAYIPVFGLSSRSGIKLGVAVTLLKREASQSELQFKTYYSTHDYQFYRFRYTSPHWLSSRIGLNASVFYKKETRHSFFGFGMSSARSNEASVTMEHTVFQSVIPIDLGKSAKVKFSVRGQITNLFDGRHPEREGRLETIKNNPALNVQSGELDALRHVDMGLSIELDNRNSWGRPTSGSHFFGSYEHIFGVGRSNGRDFDALNLDFQHYLNIWRYRVLAIRTSFSRIDATGSNTQGTPYYLASSLGGDNSLRGFTSGRFIGNDAAHISIEYRYPVYDNVDVFLFLDEGRVYRDVTQEPIFDNWQNSLGVGIRIWSAEEVIAMVHIARSEETVRFLFDLGASW